MKREEKVKNMWKMRGKREVILIGREEEIEIKEDSNLTRGKSSGGRGEIKKIANIEYE